MKSEDIEKAGNPRGWRAVAGLAMLNRAPEHVQRRPMESDVVALWKLASEVDGLFAVGLWEKTSVLGSMLRKRIRKPEALAVYSRMSPDALAQRMPRDSPLDRTAAKTLPEASVIALWDHLCDEDVEGAMLHWAEDDSLGRALRRVVKPDGLVSVWRQLAEEHPGWAVDLWIGENRLGRHLRRHAKGAAFVGAWRRKCPEYDWWRLRLMADAPNTVLKLLTPLELVPLAAIHLYEGWIDEDFLPRLSRILPEWLGEEGHPVLMEREVRRMIAEKPAWASALLSTGPDEMRYGLRPADIAPLLACDDRRAREQAIRVLGSLQPC